MNKGNTLHYHFSYIFASLSMLSPLIMRQLILTTKSPGTLVFILLTSKRSKTELSMEPHSGFEHSTPRTLVSNMDICAGIDSITFQD